MCSRLATLNQQRLGNPAFAGDVLATTKQPDMHQHCMSPHTSHRYKQVQHIKLYTDGANIPAYLGLFSGETLAGPTTTAASYLAGRRLSSIPDTLAQQWQPVLLGQSPASCPAT